MLDPLWKRAGRNIRNRLLGIEWLYRYYLTGRFGKSDISGIPEIHYENKVLLSQTELEQVLQECRRLDLPLHPDPQKNWDSAIALASILRRTDCNARILDAGSATYSRLLHWLYFYGYKNLTGINLVFDRPFHWGPVHFKPGDITATAFPDNFFDAISCISVIEHQVDVESYLREMRRILKPGGVLITSTDYFDPPLDTSAKSAYGGPVKIFSRAEIEAILHQAGDLGFSVSGDLDLTCQEKVVHWEKQDLDYTFVIFTLVKPQ